MNDHNLDDLIIDTMEPKNTKAKSFLTIIALIIVALIVGILFIKTMENDPKNTDIGFEENMSELISPELTLQRTPKAKADKDETKLSSIIEEEQTSPSPKTETIKKETVTIDEASVTPIKSTPTPPKIQASVSSKSVAPKVPERAIELPHTTERKVPVTQPVATEKVVLPKPMYHKKTTVKTTPVHTERRHPVTRPKSSRTISTSEHYYIQVGSFSQTPSKRFLNTINKHGFSYKITAPTANGTKKLLIGPYPSRTDADNALVRVKDRINKGAFIVKK